MAQGWKRLPLLVVIFLFWRDVDGFTGGASSNDHHQWGPPSDTSSPPAVQSSVSEEVGSSLFPNKPLKSTKFNPLQFVKGGFSSSQSTSYAQTAPSSSVSASLLLPVNELPLSSLTSSGSTSPGADSVLSLETQYAASGSGPIISTQGDHGNYPAKLDVLPLVVSSQYTNGQSSPSLRYDLKSTDAALPLLTQGSVSHSGLSSQAQGSATSQGSSGAELSASSGQSVLTQVGSYSGVPQSLSASSQNTPESFTSNELALPLGISSQSTSAQSSPSVSMSGTQSRYTSQLATSSRYASVGGSSSSSLSLKPQGTLSQYAPASPTKYVSAPMSAPQAIYSQATNSGSSYRVFSQVGSPSQMGLSGPLTSQEGNYYSRLLPQSQATASQYAPGYSKSLSSPQSTSSQSTSVLSSRKQYTSVSQGSSGDQFGASTGFASQGVSSTYSGLVQSQGTSQLAPAYQSSSAGVSLSSPQAVAGPAVQGSQKQFTSTFTGTQAGSSTLLTQQGSNASGGSPQLQDTASRFAPGSSSIYQSLSLSPPQVVASQSSSQKRFSSVSQGSSGAQLGTSSGSVSGVNSRYSGSAQSQDTASQFTPGSSYPYASVSLSSPQTGPSTSVQGSRKQVTSTFTGTSGLSSYPYASVSLSSPQTGPSTSVQGSRKQVTSTFTGTSGTQAESSTLLTLQGSTASDGSPQLQDTASQFTPGSSYPYASVSLSSPQTAGGSSSGVSSQSISAPGGSTSYVSSFQSQSSSFKYNLASQGTSSAQPSHSS